MDKLKNWLVPILTIIAAFLVEYFDLIQEALVSFGANTKYSVLIKLLIGVIGIVILKLQPPSKKQAKSAKAKLAKEGHSPKV